MDINARCDYTSEEMRKEIINFYLIMVAAGEFEGISLNKFMEMLGSINETSKTLPEEASK